MDPISLAVIVAIGLYVLAAPDSTTASLRSGAASAIGSGARAARQSIGVDMRSAAARRSEAHKARLKRWADRGDRTGRALLRLDRVFGRGGAIESAGRRIGAHGRAAVQAGRVAWRDGRSNGQRGLPASLQRRIAPAVRSGLAASKTALGRGQSAKPTAQSSGRQSRQPVPTKPAPPGAGRSITVAKPTAQPINTEAGLLPVAEQIATATAELAALIEAATASENLPESLKFDPGAEVKASMAVLAGATPSPDSLRAWGEAAIGFQQAVEEHVTAVVGS